MDERYTFSKAENLNSKSKNDRTQPIGHNPWDKAPNETSFPMTCFTFAKKPKRTITEEIVDKCQYRDQQDLDVDKSYNYVKSKPLLVPDFKCRSKSNLKTSLLQKDRTKDSSKELDHFLKIYDDKDSGMLNSKDAFP